MQSSDLHAGTRPTVLISPREGLKPTTPFSAAGTPGPGGDPVVLGATTAKVARRQTDGSWRYVIDNAWGDQAVAS